jgi:hypothetical protein
MFGRRNGKSQGSFISSSRLGRLYISRTKQGARVSLTRVMGDMRLVNAHLPLPEPLRKLGKDLEEASEESCLFLLPFGAEGGSIEEEQRRDGEIGKERMGRKGEGSKTAGRMASDEVAEEIWEAEPKDNEKRDQLESTHASAFMPE